MDIYCAAYGDLGKIKKLLNFGIDVNTRDEGGYTMLHWATQEGHLEVIRFLISRGSSIHLEDEEGFTLNSSFLIHFIDILFFSIGRDLCNIPFIHF